MPFLGGTIPFLGGTIPFLGGTTRFLGVTLPFLVGTMVNLVVQWSTWWYNGYLVLTIIFQIVEEEILYHQLIKIQKTTTSLL